MQFVALASSSAGNAYLLTGGSASSKLLIDAGIPFPAIQKACGFMVTDLAGCIISHGHGDHVKAVPQLLANCVDCYASKETWQSMPSAVRTSHRAISVGNASPFSVGPWVVKAFEAEHDLPGTYGFVVDAPDGERLLYLTDSAYSRYTFDGLTHIAVECNYSDEILRQNTLAGDIDRSRYQRTKQTHMSIETLEALLKANDLSKVQQIFLLHLSAANSHAEAFKARLERLTGIPVEVCAK